MKFQGDSHLVKDDTENEGSHKLFCFVFVVVLWCCLFHAI